MMVNASNQSFCKICGGNTRRKFSKVKSQYWDFQPSIFQCIECGHGVTSPTPSEIQLREMYGSTYSISDHMAVRKEKISRAKRWRKFIVNTIKVNNIVEIGSMFGDFLSTFKEMQIPLLGIEQDTTSAKIASDGGLQTICGPFDQIQIIPAGHDATEVLMTHTLEHMRDLNEFFEKLHNLFPNLQYFFAVVPNFTSTLSKVTGAKWGSLQVGPHFHHFTPESLSIALKNQGYETIRLETRGGDSLLYISTIINLFGLTGLRRKNSLILKKLYLFPILLFRGIAFLLQFTLNDEIIIIAKKIN